MNDEKDGGLDIDALLEAAAETEAAMEARPAASVAEPTPTREPNKKAQPSSDAHGEAPGESHGAAPSAPGRFSGLKAGASYAWSGFRKNYGMLLKGWSSEDRPTRRMTYFFYLCHVGVLMVAILGVQRWSQLRKERAQLKLAQDQDRKEVGEILQRQAESALKQGKLLELGRFSIDMTSGWGTPPGAHANFNSAEIDFVADCDSKETCDFLEKNLQRVRDQIIQLVTSVDRDELLTREGKKRLRRAIQDKLNSWIHEGKLNDVYISRLVMG